ncbi:MAG: DUF3052 family protein [Pseudomonadota bacterium]
MSQTAGYSGRPLAAKLGIKPGMRIKTCGAPKHYLALIAPLPEHVVVSSRLRTQIDMWHLFTRSDQELARVLKTAQSSIYPDGVIWVSWPKKSSGVASRVTEDTIRAVALPMGLVDIKVCAVDATWSALKLVIRKSLR